MIVVPGCYKHCAILGPERYKRRLTWGLSGISGLSVQSSLNRLNGQVGHLSGHQMEPSELSKQNVPYSVDGQYGQYGPAEADASDVHDVKHVSVTYACNDDVSLPCDSEVVFARQKCVTSDYLTGDNATMKHCILL